MKNYERSLKFAPKLINFVNKIKRKGAVLKFRGKIEEIIQSFGRLCYLSIILLKDSHLFKIIKLIISFYFFFFLILSQPFLSQGPIHLSFQLNAIWYRTKLQQILYQIAQPTDHLVLINVVRSVCGPLPVPLLYLFSFQTLRFQRPIWQIEGDCCWIILGNFFLVKGKIFIINS